MRKDDSFEGLFSVVKGAAFALACGLFFSLVFACLLRFCNIQSSAIYPVNQVLKTLSIGLGTLLCVRGEKGWLKGGGVGLLFTALSYLAFSAIGGDFSLSWLILLETLVGAISGALFGIIAVNVKR